MMFTIKHFLLLMKLIIFYKKKICVLKQILINKNKNVILFYLILFYKLLKIIMNIKILIKIFSRKKCKKKNINIKMK
jgi:hypothetical protein